VTSDSSPSPACPGRGRLGGDAVEGELATGVDGESSVGPVPSATVDMIVSRIERRRWRQR
jgi:hypothetical protein